MNARTLILAQNQCIERQKSELAEAWRLLSALRDGDPTQEEILEAKTWLEQNEKYRPE